MFVRFESANRTNNIMTEAKTRYGNYNLLIERLTEQNFIHDSIMDVSEFLTQEQQKVVLQEASDKLSDIQKIFMQKDTDYSANGQPLGNLRSSVEYGVAPYLACLIRLNDKIQRVGTFMRKGKYLVVDEKLTDTLGDLANYALLTVVLAAEDFAIDAVLEDDRSEIAITLGFHLSKVASISLVWLAVAQSAHVSELNSQNAESCYSAFWGIIDEQVSYIKKALAEPNVR